MKLHYEGIWVHFDCKLCEASSSEITDKGHSKEQNLLRNEIVGESMRHQQWRATPWHSRELECRAEGEGRGWTRSFVATGSFFQRLVLLSFWENIIRVRLGWLELPLLVFWPGRQWKGCMRLSYRHSFDAHDSSKSPQA